MHLDDTTTNKPPCSSMAEWQQTYPELRKKYEDAYWQSEREIRDRQRKELEKAEDARAEAERKRLHEEEEFSLERQELRRGKARVLAKWWAEDFPAWNTTYRRWLADHKSFLGCFICGDDKHWRLHYHHLHGRDESNRKWTASTSTLDKFLVEEKKCILLCANCHSSVHHNWGFRD
jgi:hypothetical protein